MWMGSRNDSFFVKSVYIVLKLESLGSFPMRIIWDS